MAQSDTMHGAVVGIGVDAVDLDRFRSTLQRRPRLLDRLFTEGERAYAERASDPTERLAVRFAAKEATMKALGVGIGAFPFTDVEIVRLDLDAPTLGVHRTAADLARQCGVGCWHVSLTHTGTVAMAFVVAQRTPDASTIFDA